MAGQRDGFDFAARMDRCRRLLAASDIDVLLVSIGADLPYLTGYTAPHTERMTMAVIPRDGDAALVVPRLEAPRVESRPDVIEVVAWDETDDPVALVARLAAGARRVAIGEQTWATFLLGLQEALPGAEFLSAQEVSQQLRVRKDEQEIAMLRHAGAAADRVAEQLTTLRFSGRTEAELARLIADMLVAEGHQESGFAIVGSGPNGASPHHHAGDRVMEPGDTVVADFGGSWAGYMSDTTRTFHIGRVPADVVEVHAVVAAAQEAGLHAARPGIAAQAVDRRAREISASAGYGEFFVHRTGHGIGLDVHEPPYLVEGNDMMLEPGMAFSIEPGVYLPGRFGVRIEDIVVLGAEGPERLNNSNRAIVAVE